MSDTAIATKITSVAVAVRAHRGLQRNAHVDHRDRRRNPRTPPADSVQFSAHRRGPAKPLGRWRAAAPALDQRSGVVARMDRESAVLSTTVVGAGGDGSYIWSASGLAGRPAINASTGAINGTPTTAGAADGDDHAERRVRRCAGHPAIHRDDQRRAVDHDGVAAAGRRADAALTAPRLRVRVVPPVHAGRQPACPRGLSINSSTGVISGTPTAAGTSTVAVTLDRRGRSHREQESLAHDQPVADHLAASRSRTAARPKASSRRTTRSWWRSRRR